MRLKEENLELRDIVKSYNLRGFSFREYLNLQTGMKFRAYTLEEILSNHEQIAKGILSKVRPLDYLQDYLHHGFYPFFLEKRNFSENLLKTMNMMVEVDILLIKQIELKYLSKIKKLLYMLAVDGPKAPNVSQLANDIQTSRATVMNYIKYLADARLINIQDSLKIAADFTKACINNTYNDPEAVNYAVNFESEIPYLLKLIRKV